MTQQALYAVIAFFLGLLAEFVLLGVLLARRQYRSFPVFTSYIAFNILCDLLTLVLSASPNHAAMRQAALLWLPVQYLLELGVLLEITWHLFKPVQSSLPPAIIKAFAGLALMALGLGSLLAWRANPHATETLEALKFRLDLTVGVLRVTLFILTAGFAQMLGIGWKDKVLRLATGLCFYSILDLIGSLIQSHHGPSMAADNLKVGAYLIELIFFLWAFTTKEVERREFSPQMQLFMVKMAGRARDTRAAIVGRR